MVIGEPGECPEDITEASAFSRRGGGGSRMLQSQGCSADGIHFGSFFLVMACGRYVDAVHECEGGNPPFSPDKFGGRKACSNPSLRQRWRQQDREVSRTRCLRAIRRLRKFPLESLAPQVRSHEKEDAQSRDGAKARGGAQGCSGGGRGRAARSSPTAETCPLDYKHCWARPRAIGSG